MAFSLLGARSRCGGGAPLLGTRARRSAQRRGMAARAAASTEEISLEAARAFLGKDAQVTFAPTSGGVNNVVQYCTHRDKRLILRVYNNGENTPRVRFEHAVLQELKRFKFSFRIPTTLPALESGATHVTLSNGAEASMFELIPGTLPKLTHVKAIGSALGELTVAMKQIKLPMDSPTAPYWDLYRVHHAITRDLFYATVAGAAFNDVRDATNYMVEQLQAVEASIDKYRAMNLPTCLIHGDAHYDNLLCADGKVSGFLDFEFCATDFAAMELAISLSKYVGEPDPMPYLQDFIDGFAEHGQLTVDEMEAIPALINLRVLSNVVYFVGRALAGEDDIKSLTSRIESYAARVRFINANGHLIVDALKKAMLAPAAR